MFDGLKDLVAPGALVLLTAFATYLFGREKLRRERSTTDLAEAQDSQQVALMKMMRERESEALTRERATHALYVQTRDDMLRQREVLNNELAALQHLGERRDMLLTRQAKQLSLLAKLTARNASPEVRELIEESGFIVFDEGAAVKVKRKTDAIALPEPVRLDTEDDDT